MKFNDLVYGLLREIPEGYVTTYKEIASALGCKAYQAVGNALNKNPYAPYVPCHRVVNSDGSLGGFALGSSKKIELLQKEGVSVIGGIIVDFDKKLWKFEKESGRQDSNLGSEGCSFKLRY